MIWNFTTSLEATVLCSGSPNFWGSSLLVCSVVLMGGDVKSTALGSYPSTVTMALGHSELEFLHLKMETLIVVSFPNSCRHS